MNEDKLISLARKIKSGTLNGAISWTPYATTNSFQTSLGIGMVRIIYDLNIGQVFDPSFTPPIATLDFLNDRGLSIGSINCYSEKDEHFSLLQEIYTLAQNSYLKTDDTLKSMFEELDFF